MEEEKAVVMKNKKPQAENYLNRCPIKPEHITWSADDAGIVTLDVENTGLFNHIAQKLLKKPKVSHIHLDMMGSFIWLLIDGDKDIITLGALVKDHFGNDAEPLYERLVKYFQILESYSFIEWK